MVGFYSLNRFPALQIPDREKMELLLRCYALNHGVKGIMESGRIKAYNIELLIRDLESICRSVSSKE